MRIIKYVEILYVLQVANFEVSLGYLPHFTRRLKCKDEDCLDESFENL